MKHMVSCKCGEVLMKSQNDEIKIRGKIFLVKENGSTFTVCKSCNTEVEVPLEVKKSTPPKLIIRNLKENG